MASRRARAGRGWDATPPRPRPERAPTSAAGPAQNGWAPDGSATSEPATGGSAPDGSRSAAGWSGGRRGRRGGQAAQRPELSDADRAREICLRQLAVRPRTRQELASALRQRGIPDEIASEVLERYGEVGMVDDRAFARAWVTSRHHGKGLAGRALAGELRRKGVEAEAIGEALDELGGETEARTARELIDRKLRSERPGPADVTMRRLVGLLARKGYPPGLAFRVVKDAMAEARDRQAGDDGAEEFATDELEAALEAAALDASANESTEDGVG